jgi:anti-anti-sigma factor
VAIAIEKNGLSMSGQANIEGRGAGRNGPPDERARTVHASAGRVQLDLVREQGVRLRTHTLTLLGDLSHGSASMLEAEIDRLSGSSIDRLVLDLRALSRIDAVGARVILLRSRLCRARGMQLELIRGSSAIQDVFDASGLTEELRFCNSPAALEPHETSTPEQASLPGGGGR